MQAVGKVLGAIAVIGLLTGSAMAQRGPAKYGEEDKPKTPAEIAAEGCRAGLPQVARQYPGTTEAGPLGNGAQRQRTAEGRREDGAGQAEAEIRRRRRKAITRRHLPARCRDNDVPCEETT